MDTITQQGYLVLADISGYTAYVAATELEHSQAVLAELLELIVRQVKPLLSISKLEGDAIFAQAPESRVARGETLLELFEATYVAFRNRVLDTQRRTTCTCNACRAIPSLDLKFIVHCGSYIVQNISGISELVGSDVNLVHRLSKNHVTEATGWRAYILFTDFCLERMGVRPVEMHRQVEQYEHLGEVITYSLDLHRRYDELTAARQDYITPEEAYVSMSKDLPAPPSIVWDWLNDPHKRARCSLTPGVRFQPVARLGGRTASGSRNHCIHGQKVAMDETILDWRPFNYLTVEQEFSRVKLHITYELVPSEDGKQTELRARLNGRSPINGWLNRQVITFLMTRIISMEKIMAALHANIVAEAQDNVVN